MAICQSYGYPDLFLTFTCNGNWSELKDALEFFPGLRPEDRPDLVARVFHIKLRHFLDDIMKRAFFGPALAGSVAVSLSLRGCWLFFFLCSILSLLFFNHCSVPSLLNAVVCPLQICWLALYNMVTYSVEFQKRGLPHAHILLWLQPSAKLKGPDDIDRFVSAEIPDKDLDPIGYEAVTSLMMHGPCGPANPRAPCMEGRHCGKYFPKQFCSKTAMDENGYPTYRRRDTSAVCVKNGVVLDNRFVVPHNVDLLVRYQAHINVEVCNQSRAIKYLFKYINKGPDRSRVVIESNPPSDGSSEAGTGVVFNEIQAYLDCRYVCAYEACWRLFSFDIHFRQPAVLRLLVHLPDHHNVFFRSDDTAGSVLSRREVNKTMLTEWFVANAKCEEMGTTAQRGPTSFDQIKTVKGVLHPIFQSACKAHGLIGDDKEWNYAILEASNSSSSFKLRALLVADPTRLFEQHWRIIGDDIEHQFRRVMRNPRGVMPDGQLRDWVLSSVDDMLHCFGSSLEDRNLPLPDNDVRHATDDRLILEEMSYDRAQLNEDYSDYVGSLNPQQRSIYEAVVQSVQRADGKMFFVHGHGGTGKTFLWKALLAQIRLGNNIALDVASSGIAALLLLGGRTAHSSLIVWDDVPMMHRHCIEALDRSLRDVRSVVDRWFMHKPFGGITVVFGGDLRQILPIIPGASRTNVVNFTMCNSPLWEDLHVLHLTVNMRLLRSDFGPGQRDELRTFAKWLLDIGDGCLPAVSPSDDQDGDLIEIPDDLLVRFNGDPLNAMVEEIYPRFVDHYADRLYLSQRAVVTPFNTVVDAINQTMLDLIPGTSVDYFSYDKVGESSSIDTGESSPYPV
ncbi:DNA helicase PIF1, ATP-dependent [Corchorus olitorius]|uniref:ATP-dependent DNA helicase n=1 Tax=Corchorus olitorius TaxID=93759 RepID=A0A1R3KWT9_9ROSI|nr:DNA helicase PIF1, ATP-dependent [Corchorus olitorius]